MALKTLLGAGKAGKLGAIKKSAMGPALPSTPAAKPKPPAMGVGMPTAGAMKKPAAGVGLGTKPPAIGLGAKAGLGTGTSKPPRPARPSMSRARKGY